MKEPLANVTLTIDGRKVTVPQGTRVIEAARRLGIEIPHYCFHGSLSIAGSCRMCLVEIEGIRKLTLACDTVAAEGMVVRTNTPQVADARWGMMEFFLLNHPLDCPICDRGGECMLHRYDMDYGPSHTRTIEPRLRFRKPQFDPLLDLERNRCVLCTRCVRAMEELAEENCIGVFERGGYAYIGTFENRPIKSIFSGMVIDWCPVGAWTSKPFRFKARVWELQQVQSTCPYCASGCRVTLWMRAGKIYRVTPPSSPEWRAYFQVSYDGREVICNQGRFGSDFVNRPDRLKQPRLKREGKVAEAGWDEALDEAARRLGEIRRTHGPDAIGLIASSRATSEEMYLLQRLARQVIGTNNVDWRVGLADDAAAQAYSRALGNSTGQVTEPDLYDVILAINTDLLAQMPVVALKIKEAARLKKAQLFVLDHRPDPWLSRRAQGVLHYSIENTARVIEGLRQGDVAGLYPLLISGGVVVEDMVKALREAKDGLIVYGLDGSNGLMADPLSRSVAQLAASLGEGWQMLPVVPERNAAGAFMVGCQPDRLPGGWADDPAWRKRIEERWGAPLPAGAGLTAPEMIEAAREGRLKALYVMGAGDFHSHLWRDSILTAFEKLELLIVQDTFESPLTERADIVLPGAFFCEKDGTLVDIAGSLARLSRGWERPPNVQDDAVILDVLAQKMGKDFGYKDGSAIFRQMMRLVNIPCPLKPGELCDPGPGEERPMRCLNTPKARAYMQWGKFFTIVPSYAPTCRFVMGAKARPIEPATPEAAPHVPSEALQLVWSSILRGRDDLGDRSETMAPLRDPEWIEMHPFDAGRLQLAEGDMVSIQGRGVTAAGPLRISARIAPGLVYVPSNWATLRFSEPPRARPEVTIQKMPAASEATGG